MRNTAFILAAALVAGLTAADPGCGDTDADGDGYTLAQGDCDDSDAEINPGADEICDAVDNNCDGFVDEDFDGDGDGFVSCVDDCDDTNSDIHPGVAEACNGLDDDCNGAVDEGFDADGDGATTCGGDCNDGDSSTYPGADEICDDIDNNCDGSADDGLDSDGDGYRSCDGDCDDGDSSIHPAATEICNFIDDDCDGIVDDGFDIDADGYTTCGGDCADGRDDINPGEVELCNGNDDNCDGVIDEGFDVDGDGFRTCDGDCDDGVASINPGAVESCDGVDEDCDGLTDEDFDLDLDGFSTCAGDCDDADPEINPGSYEGALQATTTSDGVDNDCDGVVDVDCDGTSGRARLELDLETPARGVFTSVPTLAVAGTAFPGLTGSPIATIALEGASLSTVQCSGDGGLYFSGELPLAEGLTTLQVIATDGDGEQAKAERSVIYGDRFMDLSSQTVPDAIVAELNQGTWDILGAYLEEEMDAQTIEAELLASNPIVDESGSEDCFQSWQLTGDATAYTHQDMEIVFSISNGRVNVSAKLIRPEIWVDGVARYDLEWYCGGWSDTVGIVGYARYDEVAASGSGILETDADGNVSVRFTHVEVAASGAYLDVSADQTIYDFLLDLFEADLEAELTAFVEDELYTYVSQELGPLLADELNALDLAYTLDVWGTSYQVAFDVDSLSVPDNTVDLGFEMGLDYLLDPRVPANPGAVGMSNAHSHSSAPTVSFKVGLDFFNSALHGLWEGGSLYLEGTLYEDPLMVGSTEPLLPPVVVPSAMPYLLELQVGDCMTILDITTSSGEVQTIEAAMSAQVAMDLEAVLNGYNIGFDVTFSDVTLTFEMVGVVDMDAELQASMEAGLSEMLSMYLVELEAYLESFEISYLELPVTFQSITIERDVSNPAMLTLSGEATYAGP